MKRRRKRVMPETVSRMLPTALPEDPELTASILKAVRQAVLLKSPAVRGWLNCEDGYLPGAVMQLKFCTHFDLAEGERVPTVVFKVVLGSALPEDFQRFL